LTEGRDPTLLGLAVVAVVHAAKTTAQVSAPRIGTRRVLME
jgi:hypothetical protein